MKHIIIHHNDNDGRLAAYIMAEHIRAKGLGLDEGTFISFIEGDYSKLIHLPALAGHHVYILDYSLPPDQMAALNIACSLVWIDHHKTAIEANTGTSIPGLRSVDYCGAMLTWMFVTNDTTADAAPYAIKLVDDYDCWKHKIEHGRGFHAGSQLYNTSPLNSSFWLDMLGYGGGAKRVALEGLSILKYKEQTDANSLAHIGWTSTWENLRCLCLNGVRGSDSFGHDAFKRFGILVAYKHDGDQFTVSLYSDSASGIDVGEIAKKLGGGGHKNAAGFSCKTLPMEKDGRP